MAVLKFSEENPQAYKQLEEWARNPSAVMIPLHQENIMKAIPQSKSDSLFCAIQYDPADDKSPTLFQEVIDGIATRSTKTNRNRWVEGKMHEYLEKVGQWKLKKSLGADSAAVGNTQFQTPLRPSTGKRTPASSRRRQTPSSRKSKNYDQKMAQMQENNHTLLDRNGQSREGDSALVDKVGEKFTEMGDQFRDHFSELQTSFRAYSKLAEHAIEVQAQRDNANAAAFGATNEVLADELYSDEEDGDNAQRNLFPPTLGTASATDQNTGVQSTRTELLDQLSNMPPEWLDRLSKTTPEWRCVLLVSLEHELELGAAEQLIAKSRGQLSLTPEKAVAFVRLLQQQDLKDVLLSFINFDGNATGSTLPALDQYWKEFYGLANGVLVKFQRVQVESNVGYIHEISGSGFVIAFEGGEIREVPFQQTWPVPFDLEATKTILNQLSPPHADLKSIPTRAPADDPWKDSFLPGSTQEEHEGFVALCRDKVGVTPQEAKNFARLWSVEGGKEVVRSYIRATVNDQVATEVKNMSQPVGKFAPNQRIRLLTEQTNACNAMVFQSADYTARSATVWVPNQIPDLQNHQLSALFPLPYDEKKTQEIIASASTMNSLASGGIIRPVKNAPGSFASGGATVGSNNTSVAASVKPSKSAALTLNLSPGFKLNGPKRDNNSAALAPTVETVSPNSMSGMSL